jgi:ubiquinone/menaquinone biosynthesis C-methylase UbiE
MAGASPVNDFEPHPVAWNDEKIARYWDYLATNAGAALTHSAYYGQSVAKLVIKKRPSVYVDIGCGVGDLVQLVARRGIFSIGVDTSANLIELARARATLISFPQPEFRVATAASMPVEAGSADVATLIEVIEHLDEPTIDETLAEAQRILRPGGTFIVTTPNAEDLASHSVQCPDCGSEFHTVQHQRSWTKVELGDRLRAHGFGGRVYATRVVENGSWHERAARRLYYRYARLTPHLVAEATRT